MRHTYITTNDYHSLVASCIDTLSTEDDCNDCSTNYYVPKGRAKFWDDTYPASCKGKYLINPYQPISHNK